MRTIELKYKQLIGWKTVTITVPSYYAEMTPSQFLATIRLSKEWIDEMAFFIQFFGISEKLLTRIDAFSLYKMTETLDGLRDDKSAYFGFYQQSILDGRLLAPENKLKGMCFQQLMTVDTFFSWYVTTDKEEYLDRFLAALYLQEDETYIPGNGKLLVLDTRVLEIESLPFDLKYSILINWVLIKSWLSNSYVHLFPAGDVSENSKGDKVKGKPVDWLSVFDSFVGDNIADIDAYKALPCMDAFRLLNRRIKEAKKKG